MNKYFVEFLGTAFFIYVILAIREPFAIGLAFALAIMLGARTSGGNYNPAVSVVMAAAGKLPMSDLLPYVVAQVSGGLVALELYRRS